MSILSIPMARELFLRRNVAWVQSSRVAPGVEVEIEKCFALAEAFEAECLRRYPPAVQDEKILSEENSQCHCGHDQQTEHNESGQCFFCVEPGACEPPLGAGE